MNDPRTWVPYMNTRDCSQGFCTLYCPQWCYIIFPPPPPFHFFEVNNNNNNNNPSSPSPNFSPLVIAIIGVLVSAFLLVTYYAIMSKNSWNRNVSRRDINHLHNQEDTSIHESGQASNGGGLDETLIKSIATFKYKKGDHCHGVMDGYDCSVCLGEFQEDETLRLLPKCNHAFHVTCIDTWLKSHSNCPLCRSNIVVSNPSPPHPILDSPPRNESLISPQSHAYHGREEEGTSNRNDLDFPTLIKEFNHSYSGDVGHSSAEEQNQEAMRRRCASMDFSCEAGRLSIADILRIDNEGECCGVQDCEMDNGIGPSKHHEEELVSRRNSHRHSVLSCVMSPSVINSRSFSSERFLFPKLNRGPNTILPF